MGIVTVTHQGAPVVNADNVREKVNGDITLLTVDMASKWCEVSGHSSDDNCPVLSICSNECSLHLKNGVDRSESTYIKLTKYKGWDIFISEISRYTLRVCLVKGTEG